MTTLDHIGRPSNRRRLLLTVGLAGALGVGLAGMLGPTLAPAGAAGLVHVGRAAAASEEPPTLEAPGTDAATLEECTVAVTQSDRAATFSAQMVTSPGTQRMRIRIDLEDRVAPSTRFHVVSAPGLGVWSSSSTGVKVYKDLHQITDLAAPAAYRAQVSFEWVESSGHVMRRDEKYTHVCLQPDERPALVLGQVYATGLPEAGRAEYHVPITNTGRSAAGPFEVRLSVAGTVQALGSVPGLAAGASTVVVIPGRSCPAGRTIEVLPDPQHVISEAHGGGLAETIRCPLPSTAG